MGAITSIFDKIATFNLTIDSIAVSVRNYNELKNIINSADTPVRLLLPYSPASKQREGNFIAIGNLAGITWQITDRLLLKPVVQGAGLADVTGDLVNYIADYIEVIRSNRKLTAQSHIVSWNMAIGIFKWNEIDYFGVDVVLEIDEYISS